MPSASSGADRVCGLTLGEIDMKHIIRIGIAVTAWLAVTLAAQGADVGRVPTYYRGFTPQPVMMWTGCYIGLNIGGGWSQATFVDPVAGGLGGVSSGGVIGGAQAGCDYQMGQFVFGIQVMADGADIPRQPRAVQSFHPEQSQH